MLIGFAFESIIALTIGWRPLHNYSFALRFEFKNPCLVES